MRLTSLRDSSVLSFVTLALIGCSSSGGEGGAGSAGTSGSAGTTGSAGTSGAAGTTGSAGTSGAAGTNGRGGTTGSAGSTGVAGTNGAAGTNGSGGTTGAAGRGGTTGTAGTAGSAGTAGGGGRGGTTGTAGTTGVAGTTGTGGSTALAGCTPGQMTVAGTLPGRFGTLMFTAGGEEYFMQINEWNSSSTQTLTYGGGFFFKMTTQTASTATNGGPTGFPSIFIGANSRHMTSGSNLPKAVSALTTVPTTWNWDDAGTLADDTANSYNATYDVWFSTVAAGEPTASGPSGGYLMVWLHKPADAQPIGTVASVIKAVTIPGVPGTWDIWQGKNGTRPCISYVATQTTKSLSFDLNAFIKDATTNRTGDTIMSSWYLTNIFTGFEIWRGGVNLESTSFCAIVN